MPNALVIFQGTGPLQTLQPIQFQSPTDGAASIVLSGTASTILPGGEGMFVSISMDGTYLGAAGVYSNEPNSHKTLIQAVMALYNIGLGPHTLQLVANAGVSTDNNDHFTVTLVY